MFQQVVKQNYPRSASLGDGTVLSIRPMVPADADRLWSFFQSIPSQDRFFLKHDVTKRETIENWCSHIDYDKTLPMLVLKDDELIADATLHHDRGGWLSYIGSVRIVVSPNFRGKGLGPILMRELVEIATIGDLDILEAEFMAEQQRAIQSFERLGFTRFIVMPRRLRDRRGQYHDLVVLQLDLKQRRETIGIE